MIHNLDRTTYPVPYGREDQCIYSVGRRYVNEILLTAGEKFKNLHIHFEHKLTNINLETAEVTFQKVIISVYTIRIYESV
jgi:kynurenine 3-monooxygenase